MENNRQSDNLDQTRSRYKKPAGTYIPPAKRVKSEKFDVGSEDYQRCQWDENKKKITGLINRANTSNVTYIVKELFQCNLIRYKGLFAAALLKAQETSPAFTDVYAALLAVINSRIRIIGALVLNRLILNYRMSFISNNKQKCLSCVKFIAHLTNQEVIQEVLAFQVIDHLIDKPTASSVEIVITLMKECGNKLNQLNPRYLFEVFKTLRDLSHDGDLDTRTIDLIDFLHVTRKSNFKDYPPIRDSLDLLEENDRVTHTIELTRPGKNDFHMEFNYFKLDSNWSETEAKYEKFKQSLLEDDTESSDDEEDGDNSDSSSSQEEDQKPPANIVVKKEDDKKDIKPKIVDATGADLIAFRRTIYLTIQSSVRHEEVVHKLLKSKIDPELHSELCGMILDCCGQQRTYSSIYGLIASKFCDINRREFAPIFETIFKQFYETVHRVESNKIRNIAKFYAHLLTRNSIDWSCLNCLKLRENATSSPGRCFIKFLFQELVSLLSMRTLIDYTKDPAKEEAFKELFPRDQEQDSWFSVNFFTYSELGELVEDLKQELVAKQQ